MKSHSDSAPRTVIGQTAADARRDAEIARLTAERDAALAGAVKAKPLVWNTVERRYQMFQARSLGLVYEASCDPDMGWAWAQGDGLVDFVKAANEEAAKSAAQADYEARILAAIQPDPGARQRVLAKAWTMGRDMAAARHEGREQDELAIASKYRGGSNPWFSHCQSAKGHKDASDAIRALTPPADLAAKIGGE